MRYRAVYSAIQILRKWNKEKSGENVFLTKYWFLAQTLITGSQDFHYWVVAFLLSEFNYSRMQIFYIWKRNCFRVNDAMPFKGIYTKCSLPQFENFNIKKSFNDFNFFIISLINKQTLGQIKTKIVIDKWIFEYRAFVLEKLWRLLNLNRCLLPPLRTLPRRCEYNYINKLIKELGQTGYWYWVNKQFIVGHIKLIIWVPTSFEFSIRGI